MLQFSYSDLSRVLSVSTTQLFATSVRCSRTGINCSHHCRCSRKQVQQRHYTYWRGARFSPHPLRQDRKLSSSVEPTCLYSEEGGSGHLTALDADSYLCPKVLLQQWALGGADTAGFQQHPSALYTSVYMVQTKLLLQNYCSKMEFWAGKLNGEFV